MRYSGIVDAYRKAHSQSETLHNRALKTFAGDGTTHVARLLDPYRPYITHAKGSRKWDVDGNEYIDYVMGHGALILGHSHPDIVTAVQEQVAKGTHYGENHDLEIEWAELIKSMMPSAERVEFFPCGNEANMMAMRVARCSTGRTKILKFADHFHGWNDHLSPPESAGTIPEDNSIYTASIPANDLDAIERELATKQYAALFTEGGGASLGGAQPLHEDFTKAIHDVTRMYGTLWILDEVVTGFRDYVSADEQGWQSVLGVKPDLTTLGKCIGGGLGAGAIVGRADIMDAFHPTDDKEYIRHTGTWNANPLTAAAGVAACRLYKTGEPQRVAASAAATLRRIANGFFRNRDLSVRLYSRSIAHMYIGPIDCDAGDDTTLPTENYAYVTNPQLAPMRQRLCLHLLQRGVATMGARCFIMSCVHTEEDINRTVEALTESIESMIADDSELGPLFHSGQ